MIYRSPYPDLDIPDDPFPAVALRNAERLGDKAALIDAPTGRTITYRELRELVDRGAAGLHTHGVRQGDVVAIVGPNSIDWMLAFYAITSIGAIAAPANPAWTEAELEIQFERQRVGFLLVSPEHVDRARAAAGNVSADRVIILGDHATLPTFARLLECPAPPPTVSIDPARDIAAYFNSSGTTGLPKSVMLSHRALVAMGLIHGGGWEIQPHDVIPGQLPLFHAFGLLVNLAGSPIAGATTVVLPRFTLEAFFSLIQDYRVTRIYAAPPMVIPMAKHPLVDQYDLSSIEVILSGAAPLGAEVEDSVRRRIGCRVKQGFGMTESLPTMLAPDEVPRAKQGSVGVLSASNEARVVDPQTGLDCATGEAGELWTRGPQAMSGYLGDPEATTATLDADGWIHTGDLGYVDEDGYFYIVDRLKELIKYKAYQVAPAELEAVLLTHPAVADCAVVRYPNEDAGEIPKAFVVARAPLDADELMAWVAERVAPYKKVRMVEFVDVIPKSASGKILRRELIARDRAPSTALA